VPSSSTRRANLCWQSLHTQSIGLITPKRDASRLPFERKPPHNVHCWPSVLAWLSPDVGWKPCSLVTGKIVSTDKKFVYLKYIFCYVNLSAPEAFIVVLEWIKRNQKSHFLSRLCSLIFNCWRKRLGVEPSPPALAGSDRF
jgi:hypothetical protein